MQAHAGDSGQNKLKKNEETEAHMYSKYVAKISKGREKVTKWKKGPHFHPEMR